MVRKALRLEDEASFIMKQMGGPGALLTAVDGAGRTNVMAIGWGLIGRSYHGHPIFTVAVSPPRYTWRFLESSGDFVVAVGGDEVSEAIALCGTKSGREVSDKFAAAGLTPVRSYHVAAPSIRECRVNVECRTYHRQHPPHKILTPEHRHRPVEEQHTIYFAEVLGVYSGQEEQG